MSEEKKPGLHAVPDKTVEARPDEAIHACTEELYRIVQKRDKDGLEEWIKRYIRRMAVSYPVISTPAFPPPPPGATPEKLAQMRVMGNLVVALSPACVWSEKIDVQKGEKHAHAEIYFLDVLNTMGAK